MSGSSAGEGDADEARLAPAPRRIEPASRARSYSAHAEAVAAPVEADDRQHHRVEAQRRTRAAAVAGSSMP
jgi:hypothetical protein